MEIACRSVIDLRHVNMGVLGLCFGTAAVGQMSYGHQRASKNNDTVVSRGDGPNTVIASYNLNTMTSTTVQSRQRAQLISECTSAVSVLLSVSKVIYYGINLVLLDRSQCRLGPCGQHKRSLVDILIIVPTQVFLLLLIPWTKWVRYIPRSVLAADHESDLSGGITLVNYALKWGIRGDGGVSVFGDWEDV